MTDPENLPIQDAVSLDELAGMMMPTARPLPDALRAVEAVAQAILDSRVSIVVSTAGGVFNFRIVIDDPK